MVPFMGADGATACHGQGPLIDGVRQWILQHPQFHGRAKGLSIELEAEGVVVRGQLPRLLRGDAPTLRTGVLLAWQDPEMRRHLRRIAGPPGT
jgi:hypothetical protein